MIKEETQGFSLRNFTAAVIGAGGLGCNIAVHLAGAGIGKLLLFDDDKISESNLNRQFLYTSEDLGKNKALTSAEKLSEYAKDCRVSAFPVKVTKNSIPYELKNCHIIFLAADNPEARKVMSDFSFTHKIPLVLGGIDGFYGKAYLYIPHASPCPHCAGMLDGGKTGTNISAVAGIIGSLQCTLGIRYLLTKDTSSAHKLHIYDGDSFASLEIISWKKCVKCNNIKKEETV